MSIDQGRDGDSNEMVVSKSSQANAPRRCSLADCASVSLLADNRLTKTRHLRTTANGSRKDQPTKPSIEFLRKKRLRRNRKKKEALRKMSKRERREKFKNRAACMLSKQTQTLEQELLKVKQDHEYEKRLSAFSWKKYKNEKAKKLKLYRYYFLNVNTYSIYSILYIYIYEVLVNEVLTVASIYY